MNEYRQEFLENNPDKQMIIGACLGTGYGTHKFDCTWQGEWTAAELVDYVDGGTNNYGGRVENIRRTDDGRYRGTVCVYYD
jgi:hypothetical protein